MFNKYPSDKENVKHYIYIYTYIHGWMYWLEYYFPSICHTLEESKCQPQNISG